MKQSERADKQQTNLLVTHFLLSSLVIFEKEALTSVFKHFVPSHFIFGRRCCSGYHLQEHCKNWLFPGVVVHEIQHSKRFMNQRTLCDMRARKSKPLNLLLFQRVKIL